MSDDSDLRAQFEKWKQQDALSAPPFSASWEAARRSARGPRRPVFRVASITAALAMVAIAIFLVQMQPRPATVAISRWHSPTAFLLQTSGSPLLTTMPQFGQPLMPSFKEPRN